jgi:hypothetical protein
VEAAADGVEEDEDPVPTLPPQAAIASIDSTPHTARYRLPQYMSKPNPMLMAGSSHETAYNP